MNFLTTNKNITCWYRSVIFAAMKTEDSLVTWGRDIYGGDSSSVASSLSCGISAIYSGSRLYSLVSSLFPPLLFRLLSPHSYLFPTLLSPLSSLLSDLCNPTTLPGLKNKSLQKHSVEKWSYLDVRLFCKDFGVMSGTHYRQSSFPHEPPTPHPTISSQPGFKRRTSGGGGA